MIIVIYAYILTGYHLRRNIGYWWVKTEVYTVDTSLILGSALMMLIVILSVGFRLMLTSLVGINSALGLVVLYINEQPIVKFQIYWFISTLFIIITFLFDYKQNIKQKRSPIFLITFIISFFISQCPLACDINFSILPFVGAIISFTLGIYIVYTPDAIEDWKNPKIRFTLDDLYEFLKRIVVVLITLL